MRPRHPIKTQGDRRTEQITDSTALWALDTLASGLYAHILDPSDRWFSLGVKGVPFTQLSFEMQAYLEDVSEKIFTVFADPRSRFLKHLKRCCWICARMVRALCLTSGMAI